MGKAGEDSACAGFVDRQQRDRSLLSASGLSATRRLACCVRRRLILRVLDRGGGGVEVEPEACLGASAEADGAELVGVFVDPCAGDAEVDSELPRVEERGRLRAGVAAFAQELCDALGDLLDGVGCELGGGVSQTTPLDASRGCGVGSRFEGVWCSHVGLAFQRICVGLSSAGFALPK
jgi:hypothetical protein